VNGWMGGWGGWVFWGGRKYEKAGATSEVRGKRKVTQIHIYPMIHTLTHTLTHTHSHTLTHTHTHTHTSTHTCMKKYP